MYSATFGYLLVSNIGIITLFYYSWETIFETTSFSSFRPVHPITSGLISSAFREYVFHDILLITDLVYNKEAHKCSCSDLVNYITVN